MATFDYAEAQADAKELIDEFGQEITITTPANGTLDPATDTKTGGSPVERTTTGVVLEYSSFTRSGVRNEPGSLIKAGDKQLLLSALGIDGLPIVPPKVDDIATLADGVTTYTITSDAPLSPAGIDVIYDVNIRGSK